MPFSHFRKQVVGKAGAPCTAGLNMHEDNSDPQLAHDIMECLEKVINSVCSIGEISDYGKKKNKGSISVNCRHSGKIDTHKKKATVNIKLPRIN